MPGAPDAVVQPPAPRHWLDGEPTETVPADNRGLAFGDGVFRTVLVSGGRPVWLARQVAILCRDAATLGLDADPRVIEDDMLRGARAATTPFAALRLTLWRDGQGWGRGYEPVGQRARRLMTLSPYQPDPRAVWTVGVSRHLAWPEPYPGTKHLNRLLAVAVAAEARAAGVSEMLVRLGGGPGDRCWGSGGKTSLYVVKKDIMYIRNTTLSGIEGAGIEWLREHAQSLRLDFARPEHLPELTEHDEWGLINSLTGPRTITVDLPGTTERTFGHRNPALPSPITRQLQACFAAEAGTPPLQVSLPTG